MTDGQRKELMKLREQDMDWLDSHGYYQDVCSDVWGSIVYGHNVFVELNDNCEWSVTVTDKDISIDDMDKERIAYTNYGTCKEQVLHVENCLWRWYGKDREYEGVSLIDCAFDPPVVQHDFEIHIFMDDNNKMSIMAESPKKALDKELFKPFGTNVFKGHTLRDMLFGMDVTLNSPLALELYKRNKR